MGKLLLFFMLSIFLLDVTSQTQEKKVKKSKTTNNTEVNHKTFKGVVIQLKPSFQLNTGQQTQQAPHSSPPQTPFLPTHPALRLLSTDTSAYFTGSLSMLVIPGIYVLAVAVGIPANAAILATLATKVRTVSSAILYCSLAVSDIFLLISLIFKAHYHLHGNNWVLGEISCRIVTACFYGNLYCSAHTLACISINRYLAVVHPFFYKSLPKRACAAWATLAMWGVFWAGFIPEVLVRQSYLLPQLGITTCHDVLPLDDSSHAPMIYYKLGLTFLGLTAPLVVTAVFYVRIVWELNRSHHDWALYVKASSLVFVIFVVCFGPAGMIHVMHYMRLFASGEDSFYGYFNGAVCLCCLHACLDPFLFQLMSKTAGSKVFMTFKEKSLSIST
ncbi:hypothetical protein UPYG_G00280030 [Umbra pygmaea]|uniref:G-protein coupled receptors family 1 profile domain-containing protein n=1 Tax=Umbra pygmaea TaxID=75934 RepID=A0ABD0W7E1_UMBPY